ncbi:MAG TPA: DUF4156 domain-containing protein [Rhodanobacteraceae bacterium]|nr:DUF4156 domain-containing protein [Rhodanobacteraceae bacterium]
MNRIRIVTLSATLFTIALAGCAVTPTREALAVQDADAAMVKGCAFVGEVTGTSGWGGLAASAGEANAQNEAREKAAKLGATNIVWDSLRAGYAPSVSGKAYRCDAAIAPANP